MRFSQMLRESELPLWMARAVWNGDKFLEIKKDAYGWRLSVRDREGHLIALPSRTDFATDDWRLVQPPLDVVHPQIFTYNFG